MSTAAREAEITRLAHHVAKGVATSPVMTEALRFFVTCDREPRHDSYTQRTHYPRVGSIKALLNRQLIIKNAQGSLELTAPGREVARLLFVWVPAYDAPKGRYARRDEGSEYYCHANEVAFAAHEAYAEADVRRADAELFPANLVDDRGFLLATPTAVGGIHRPGRFDYQPRAEQLAATDDRTAQELNSDPTWTTTPDSPPAMIAGGLLRSNEDTAELMRLARAEQATSVEPQPLAVDIPVQPPARIDGPARHSADEYSDTADENPFYSDDELR